MIHDRRTQFSQSPQASALAELGSSVRADSGQQQLRKCLGIRVALVGFARGQILRLSAAAVMGVPGLVQRLTQVVAMTDRLIARPRKVDERQGSHRGSVVIVPATRSAFLS